MSDQTKLDALTVIGALAALLDSPHISDRDELTLRNAVRLMRNDLDAVEAINALEFLAREGYGPSFTQRAVGVGGRAAMGTGDDSTSFRAACRALAYTTSGAYAANQEQAKNPNGRWHVLEEANNPCRPIAVPALTLVHATGSKDAVPVALGDRRFMVAEPVPCAPRADNVPAVVEFNSRAKKWKWVKIQDVERVSWEFFITPQISERVEFPARWLFDSEMRKEIFLELRRIRAKRVF